jgi:hypothetical protein
MVRHKKCDGILQTQIREAKYMSVVSGIKRRVKFVMGKLRIFTLERKKLTYALGENTEPIVVSFTTYPPRLKWVNLVVRSMMVQSMKPDKIIMYIGDDVEFTDLPGDIIDLKQYGLEIKKVEGNLKPHKKYQYAMEEFPDSLIITIDDDLIYHKDFIKTLIEGHHKFPESVIAIRGHEITFDKYGRVQSYKKWNKEIMRSCNPSMKLFAAGGSGGVLYPPNCLCSTALDKDLVKKLCLNADDIWLKVMELMVGTKVSIYKPELYCKYIFCRGLGKDHGLNEDNVALNGNDRYLEDLVTYFNLDVSEMEEPITYMV